MINQKFGVSKSYATAENAQKAIMKEFAGCIIRFIIVQLDEYNCKDAKHYGRFIPVALGQQALDHFVHTKFHVVG